MSVIDPDRTVFFAWQSDLPAQSNLNPIRNGIRKAIASIGSGLAYDHATRNMSGSEDIPAQIRDKIEVADIFIADISTIRRAHRGRRATQNPNVVFELGFAVAHLGWSRIILMFNEQYGNLKTDIPFDFQSNRIAKYNMSERPTAEQRRSLNVLLLSAIEEIEKTKPKRPSELKGKSSYEIQHERDKDKLIWLLEHLHFPTLDTFVHDAPGIVSDRVFSFYYDFQSIFKNSLWHLYDDPMQVILQQFSDAWDEALSYANRYSLNNSGTHYLFKNNYHLESEDEVSADWDAIAAACETMSDAQRKMLERIRTSYHEIDLMQTNKTAWENYIAQRD